MTREEAINILIAVAVCSTEYLYCDEHCPFYHPEGVRVCNEWNDEMAKEAVETISALRQQEHFREVTKKVEPLTNAQKIRAMSDEELAVLIAREIVHVPHSGFYVAKSAWLRWLHETV